MISLSLLRFRLLEDDSPTIFHKLELFVGPQRPAMEEQNGYSDAKDEIQDKDSCDARVGKQDTSCSSEQGNCCLECDPTHNESMARCCDGRSTLSYYDEYILIRD
jgi:hypothetical protein